MTRLLALSLLCLTLTAGYADDRPNILFILADDLGYEMLGSYGGAGAKTPHLDQLAAEGMRFTRAYGSPVCTPTRMSLYTGLYPTTHQITGVLPVHNGTKRAIDLVDTFPTYAQRIRAAGYRTATTGKWQLATLEYHPDHIRDAGFDSWCVWQIWKDNAKTTRFWEPTFNHDGAIRSDIADRFGPDVLADYVVSQMETAVATDEPFLIHHNMLLPHIPIVETPKERADKSEAALRKMITYMDGIVGRLVAEVDRLGISKDTCIIFLGDNGTDLIDEVRETSDGPVTGGKRTLDDGGTHLPLIVRWPGTIAPESVVTDLIDVADFYPTFCELAGITEAQEKAIDGVSFAPRLIRNQPHSRTITVAGYKSEYSIYDGTTRTNGDLETSLKRIEAAK